MNGGSKFWIGSTVVSAAVLGSLGGAPARAADLGGNCCADLEERIAELEATTARKGNRKVSLEVSGHVNETLLFWDDGFESNVGLYTNDNARSRFRFKGKAKIDGDWEAGYQIEIGVRTANSKRFNQDDKSGSSDPANVGFDLRDSYWYLKSKTYGSAAVGQQATATDGITEINQTQTADFSKFSDVEDSGLGLNLRGSNGALGGESWRRLIGIGGDQPGEGERRFNVVKYTTPEFAGFAISASWGEDDFWDVALRYKGELGDFKIVAGLGYGEILDSGQTKTVCSAVEEGLSSDTDCNQVGGSLSVLHAPSGIFLNFGAGYKKDEIIADTTLFTGLDPDDEQTFWALQAGIEQKWLPYGKTTVYGEYYDYEGGATTRRFASADALNPAGFDRAAVWDAGIQSYGGGIAQGFDAAALVLYVSYRHYEADLTVINTIGGVGQAGTQTDIALEDLDVVLAGGIIKF
ncbi:MAG: porin [Hyphomicrobium sp.]|nr:porin [Hyphomicrobium sp.]